MAGLEETLVEATTAVVAPMVGRIVCRAAPFAGFVTGIT